MKCSEKPHKNVKIPALKNQNPEYEEGMPIHNQYESEKEDEREKEKDGKISANALPV